MACESLVLDLCVLNLLFSTKLRCAHWLLFEDLINIFIVNATFFLMHLWSRYVLSLQFQHFYFTAMYIS